MPLTVDTAAAVRRLAPDELSRWAAARTVFLSSEMRDLGPLRVVVADALRKARFSVVWFEDLGGRDEDAERAYLDGVARSDIYVGIVADRYGTMLPSGRSPTHEEYLKARRRGKRISFWLQRDATQRQGHAVDFAQEVQAFHTTGQFIDASDLAARLLERLGEIAADDEAPWVKIGDLCVRATRIRDEGGMVRITAEVRDDAMAHALEQLRPDGFRRPTATRITTARRTGEARVKTVVTDTHASSVHDIELTAAVSWADGRPHDHEATINGVPPDDQTEALLRRALLGMPLHQLTASHIDDPLANDPLNELDCSALPAAAQEAVGRLLIVERLVGTGRASRIDRFSLGPVHEGRQRVMLEWDEPHRDTHHLPGTRRIEGTRLDQRLLTERGSGGRCA